MGRRRKVVLPLLLAAFTSVSSATLDAAALDGHAASVAIVAVEPDLLLPVDHKSVIKVTVEYNIENFQRGKFFLFPQYRISDQRSTSGRLRSKEKPYLETASGRTVVECDLSSLESNTEVERPLKLSILLLVEGSDHKGRGIATSQTISILTK